jgi:hypothetical protein
MAEHDHDMDAGEGPGRLDSTTEQLRHALVDAAKDDADRATHERNAGAAIFVLAALVVLLLLAIVTGATDAFQP